MTKIVPEGGARRPQALRRVLALALVAGGLSLTAPAVAADIDNFMVNTADDFVKLCRAKPEEPNYVAAIHFCHGFATGAYRYYQAMADAAPEHKYICPPNPPPTRTEAIESFLSWTDKHPDQLQQQAIDAIFRFLGDTYPCKQQ